MTFCSNSSWIFRPFSAPLWLAVRRAASPCTKPSHPHPGSNQHSFRGLCFHACNFSQAGSKQDASGKIVLPLAWILPVISRVRFRSSRYSRNAGHNPTPNGAYSTFVEALFPPLNLNLKLKKKISSFFFFFPFNLK